MSVAEKSEKKSGGLGETVSVIIQALLLALVIRTFLFQPFSIPSGSMRPTLLEGDYLFVTKWAYGFSRYSLPFGPDLFSGRIWGAGGGRPAGRQGDAGKTGDENDLHGRIELCPTTGEFNTVETRHDDVGEQQIEHFALERLESCTALIKIFDDVPCAFERVHEEAAKTVIVFREENFGHNRPRHSTSR